jgi:hypothetical protein
MCGKRQYNKPTRGKKMDTENNDLPLLFTEFSARDIERLIPDDIENMSCNEIAEMVKRSYQTFGE